MSRNNILHAKPATTNSISTRSTNEDIDYDYDLMNKGFPAGQEVNGIANSTPIYDAPAPTLDFATKTGDFRLASNSPGYDAGVIIPNFTDTYTGNGPDMGAHEAGTDPMVFGVNSVYPIPLHPLPIDLQIFDGENIGQIHRLTWITESEINASHFEIEHSEFGTKWSVIETVQTKANQSYPKLYSFKYKPSTKSNYYRLKMIDLDGSYKYSNIIFLKGSVARIELAPNPAHDIITISNIHDKSNIFIFDGMGRLILSKIYNGQFMDIQLLPKGIYYLKVNNGDGLRFLVE